MQNNPINWIDPLGLEPPSFPVKFPNLAPSHNPFLSMTQGNVNYAHDIYNPFTFRDLVTNFGPWDYKRYDPDWQDFGNYNYGVTGAATGLFTLETLLREAGRMQSECARKPEWGNPKSGAPYGDDPVDQLWIIQGWIDYWLGMYGQPKGGSLFYGIPVQYFGGIISRTR